MRKPIAININFDSLNQNLGFNKNFKDPSFFECFDRFLEFSNKFGFKYSIYIIGKDLENPEISSRVKDWSQMGHEIGNHSFTHPMSLGTMKKDKIHYEIMKSHEIIHNTTNVEPQGFICPGWATSKHVLDVLIDANYLYDTSLFPSLSLLPIVLKNAFNHIKKPEKIFEIVNRRDYLFFINKPKEPFISDNNFNKLKTHNNDSIVVLPLPVLNKLHLPIWHTLCFFYNKERYHVILKKYLHNCEFFYYLLHPADLLEFRDFNNKHHTIERMNIPLKQKSKMLKESFDVICNSDRPIVTMKELALNFINK